MEDNTMVINFYNTTDQYGCFSNFYKSPITIGGVVYPTTEHFFQIQKFIGADNYKTLLEVSLTLTAKDVAIFGRDKTKPLRKDWEQVKEDVMYTALEAKFTQHDHLYEQLMGTKGAKLVEHTANDSYWGDGGNGTGKNRLGHLLMQLRGALALKH